MLSTPPHYARHGLGALRTHFVTDNELLSSHSVKCFNLVFLKQASTSGIPLFVFNLILYVEKDQR